MMNVQERAADGGVAGGDKAFDDLTDTQKEDFIYVY